MNTINTAELLSDVSKMVSQETENKILKQLSWFIERNLLVIHSSQPVLTYDEFSRELKVSQQVELVLKDKEYVEKLEKENSEMKDLLERLKKAFNFENHLDTIF